MKRTWGYFLLLFFCQFLGETDLSEKLGVTPAVARVLSELLPVELEKKKRSDEYVGK